ncbi:MAG: hypothetical protein KC933_29580 [Myxococcales bacterium]|nr:hypothetical protein [Myxococcales bacterium]
MMKRAMKAERRSSTSTSMHSSGKASCSIAPSSMSALVTGSPLRVHR